jgi:hypothetical protein
VFNLKEIDSLPPKVLKVDFRKLSFLYYQALSRGLLFFLPPLVSVAKIADIYRYHEIL